MPGAKTCNVIPWNSLVYDLSYETSLVVGCQLVIIKKLTMDILFLKKIDKAKVFHNLIKKEGIPPNN